MRPGSTVRRWDVWRRRWLSSGDPDDAVVVALRRAEQTGAEKDIKQARGLFMKLKPADRRAALATLVD